MNIDDPKGGVSNWVMVALYFLVATSPFTAFVVNIFILAITLGIWMAGPRHVRSAAGELSVLNSGILAFALAMFGLVVWTITIPMSQITGGVLTGIAAAAIGAIIGAATLCVKAALAGLAFADRIS